MDACWSIGEGCRSMVVDGGWFFFFFLLFFFLMEVVETSARGGRGMSEV